MLESENDSSRNRDRFGVKTDNDSYRNRDRFNVETEKISSSYPEPFENLSMNRSWLSFEIKYNETLEIGFFSECI